MKTREAYLQGKCSHEQYYSQFVTAHIKLAIKNTFTIDQLKNALKQDKNLNNIPLHLWDSLAMRVDFPSLKAFGDYLTLAGKVCILKEAARQMLTL